MNKALSSPGEQMPRINSLVGIKVIAVLLVFWWHCFSLPQSKVDLGARGCELFFVCSGFLVGYNSYFRKIEATWKASFEYYFKRFVKFWPVHICAFIPVAAYVFYTNGGIDPFNGLIALVNIFLLQAWSCHDYVFFSFNGATWFLSALLFCYFMVPVLLSFSKKVKSSTILFFVVGFVRIMLEFITNNSPKVIFGINVHASPIIRCLEFFMGMLMVPLFFKLKENKVWTNKVKSSLIEILTIGIVITIIILMADKWLKGGFVPLLCLLVFVFAFDSGILSRLFSLKFFVLFSMIQIEFFVFHTPMVNIVGSYLDRYIENDILLTIVIFALALISSILYKVLLEKPFSVIMDKLYKKVMKCIE